MERGILLAKHPFKSMKKSLYLVATAALLTACGSAPKLTPEQRAALRVSTLNVYEDNRVGLVTKAAWAWTSSPDVILGVEIDGRIYNARDTVSLRRIHGEGSSTRRPELIQVELANGQKLFTEPENVNWVYCKTNKQCGKGASIISSDYQNDLGRILTAVHQRSIEHPETITMAQGDPRTELMTDSRTRPTLYSVGDTVNMVTGPALTRITERVADVIKAWDDKAADRKAKADANSRAFRAMEQERIAQLRNERVGTQTYCESRATTNPDLRGTTQVSCSRYGNTNTDELMQLGWNVVSHNVRTGTDSVGVYTFYTHGITVQKVK